MPACLELLVRRLRADVASLPRPKYRSGIDKDMMEVGTVFRFRQRP